MKAKQLPTDWLMWIRRQTIGDTLSDVEAYEVCDFKEDRIGEAKGHTL